METRHISLSFCGWAVTKECRLFTVLEKAVIVFVERPVQQGYVWIKTAYVSGQACLSTGISQLGVS